VDEGYESCRQAHLFQVQGGGPHLSLNHDDEYYETVAFHRIGMESHGRYGEPTPYKYYSRISMFRLDAMYVTYINIHKLNHSIRVLSTPTTTMRWIEFSRLPGMIACSMDRRLLSRYGRRSDGRRACPQIRGLTPIMSLYQDIRPLLMINEYKLKAL
jgi:hypothetical protein